MTARRALAMLVTLVAVLALGATSAAKGSTEAGPTATLTNDVVRNLNLATLDGAVPSSQTVTVGIFLSNPRQAAEDAYVKQLYNPSSSNYRNFLTPAAFTARFGVPAANFQAAESWARSSGLTVKPVTTATNYFLATGTAEQVSAAFQTPLNLYTTSDRGTFYANPAAPTVPANLGISDVLGLNDFNRFFTPRVSAPVEPGAVFAGPGGLPGPNTGLLSPHDLWSIYDLPSTNKGNGVTMGILGWGVLDGVVPDLRSFEAEWGLPGVPVNSKYYGDTSTADTNDGATGEWELDTQASTGMAPNVSSETLYFAHHNTDADILASIAGWVNDKHGPRQASASYGECENVGNANAVLTDGIQVPGDLVLEQAVVEGRTLFASTGDTGSSCPIAPVNTNGLATQGYPGLEWPSVSPWAVAVGGTVLNSDGNTPAKRAAEYAWAYTGGGNSSSEPAGSYQAGVAPTNCTFDPNGNPYGPGVAAGPICRSTPDVAAISGDVATGNGLLITNDSGSDQQGAGTSLSSPLWLGMWARIQAAAPGKGLGFANYSFYKLAKATPGRDFYDITIGDNQPYPAKPGYDNVSGWGTPAVSQLMLDLTGRLTPSRKVPAPPVVSTPTTTCGTAFTDSSGDDIYTIQGQNLAPQGTSPQLDILSGRVVLSPDGQTLRTILTIRNLSTAVPAPGGENDYQVVWTFNGTTYFTQLAVEQSGTVLAWDGQLVRVSLENKYLQEHAVTGKLVPGENGTVEVDAPLTDFPGVSAGTTFLRPSGATYVREGVTQGPLEPVDSASPFNNALLGACSS